MDRAPSPFPHFVQRVVIGVGDVAVSNNPDVTLSTYALGSCIAVVAYDPDALVGGILHLMLPNAKIAPEKALTQPAMFANTGLPLLFASLRGMRAELPRIQLFIAGGACVLAGNDSFQIGARNLQATDAILSQMGLIHDRGSTGGTINRTIHLEVGSGEVTLKTPAANEVFTLVPARR
jgi:chemotaxis protein CheD